MKNVEMPELQRQALEHLERARREGLSIKAYARAHGIPAQQIYDAIARMRRRGALPTHSSKSSKFIAVTIAPQSPTGAAVCRMLIPSGLVIECLQWPPRTWLDDLARAPDASA